MWFKIITLPLVGALIGWITNLLAIKLIFRPYQPFVIPVINYKIQGVIPKRRDELAKSVGQVIGEEILPLDDLFQRLQERDIKDKVAQSVIKAIYFRLDERVPLLVPAPLRKVFMALVADILKKETPILISRLLMDLGKNIRHEIDLATMIQEKINSYDLQELEKIILLIATQELKHIEILGAFLGFFIGLAQAVMFYFLQ